MTLLQRLRAIFGGGGQPTGGPPPACRPVKLVFEQFRQVLACNNRALELMADLGEMLGGDYLFDRHYIETSTAALMEAVRQSIDALNVLDEGKHPALYPVYRRLTEHLQLILQGREDRDGPRLLGLQEIQPRHAAIVGGKMAHLAEIIRNLPLKVPPGFVITTRTYHDLIDANRLRNSLDRFETLMAEPAAEPATLERARQHLAAALRQATPPAGLLDGLSETLDRVRQQHGPPLSLAVRSSAQEEDMDFSFAGQFRSVLNVKLEIEAVYDAYLAVVASLFDPAAVAYRRRVFPEEGQMSIAAGCQVLIDARVSGTAYSVDPRQPAGEKMVVVGAWGQGVTVVESRSPADTFLVDKNAVPLQVELQLGAKAEALYPSPQGGLETRLLPPDLQAVPCLDEMQLARLRSQVIQLEHYFKRPVDVEWAMDHEGELFMLQARPLVVPGRSTDRQQLPDLLQRYPLLVSGRGKVAQQGIGAGPVRVVNSPEDLEDFPPGGVLVARRDSSRYVRVMHQAAAIVTEIGTPVSHMATLCREYGLPCLVQVPGLLHRVSNGDEITVDAEDRRIYQGRVPELLAYRASTSVNIGASQEFRLTRRLLKAASRLHLVDPLLQEFTPEQCQTYHDLLRYTHEMAVRTLVNLGRDERCLLHDHLARRLDLPIPAGILVIDLGGGLTPDAPRDAVGYGAIASIPFRAILQGMLFPEVWHRTAMPVGWKDLVSSMVSAPRDAVTGQYAGHNIAIISRAYVNLCFRFGYHFNIIDAHCDEVERDNHIYFRFLGGATDLTKRSRRARMIATILRAFDFNVQVKGDLVIGRAGNMVQSEMERTLDILGRLVGFTRQLDVRLDTDHHAERYAEAFLQGNYEILTE